MMPNPETAAPPIEQRVLQLERRHRRLQAVLAVTGMLACVGIAAHFLPGPSTLAASRWVLLDRHQAVRAEMVSVHDGSVVLRLNNADGKARTLWRLERDGSAVFRMTDTQGFNRVELGIDREGTPLLTLTGPDGRTRTRLGLFVPDHQPGIMLYDPDRELRWSAP